MTLLLLFCRCVVHQKRDGRLFFALCCCLSHNSQKASLSKTSSDVWKFRKNVFSWTSLCRCDAHSFFPFPILHRILRHHQSFFIVSLFKKKLISLFVQTPKISEASLSDILLTILLVIVFLIVSDCYVESIVTTHLKRNILTKTSLITCFICGIFFNELWNVSELSLSIFLAFLFLTLGT